MPDPFIKKQAKENKAKSFRAQEAQSLTKSVGTAGKTLVEPRQKEDKTSVNFTQSVDMGDRDDIPSTEIKSPTYEFNETKNLLNTNENKSFLNNIEQSVYNTFFKPFTPSTNTDQIRQDLLNPDIDNPYADLTDKSIFINLIRDRSFKKEFDEAERLRAIKRRKTSENSIRNSYYDLFTDNSIYNFSPKTAETLTNIVDFTPIVGDVAGFEDAIINYKSGRYGAAAFDATLATIGLAPVAGDVIRKALNGYDIGDLAPQMFDYRGRKSPFSDVGNYGKGSSPLGSSVDKAIKEWDDFVKAEGLTPYLNKASIENPDLYIAQKLDIIEALPSFPTRLKLLTLSKLDDLWVRRGWNPGAKGKFFTDIDDSEALLLDNSSFIKDFHTNRISDLGKLGKFRLEDILYHKDLFDIYPELKDMNISWKSLSPRTGGHYSPSEKEIVINQDAWKKRRDAVEGSKEDVEKINDQLMDLVIHEVQHAIQDIEGVGGFSRYLIEGTYGGPGSYEVTRALARTIENDQLKINNMLDPKNTVTDKENQIKNLQKKILANKFKLDNFLSRLSFTRKIKRTSSPKLEDMTEAEIVSGYYRQFNELEARLAEDRRKMQKRFLASPYRSLRSFDAGYSGFDILSQASKDKDGIIDVEKYDQFVSTIYDGIKSFVKKTKKFSRFDDIRKDISKKLDKVINDTSYKPDKNPNKSKLPFIASRSEQNIYGDKTRQELIDSFENQLDILKFEMTPEQELETINNLFYEFVYRKKLAQDVVIHDLPKIYVKESHDKIFTDGYKNFGENFKIQLKKYKLDSSKDQVAANYISNVLDWSEGTADFSDLEKINNMMYNLYKDQVYKASNEIFEEGIIQNIPMITRQEIDDPAAFFDYISDLERKSPSYAGLTLNREQIDREFYSREVKQIPTGKRFNVPEAERTPFDDTYTVYKKADRLDVDPIPSISGPAKNIDKEMIPVFPKPAKLYPEGQSPDAAGDYINPITKESVADRNVSSASIKLTSAGKADFRVSNDNVDTVGSEGKGKTLIRTNLFDKSKGWKWINAPKQYENIPKIISVEKSGKHYYTVETDFSKGVNLTKYPEKPTQPKLRPTVKGELEFGNQIGTISVRGKEHPVFEKITTFNKGGLI